MIRKITEIHKKYLKKVKRTKQWKVNRQLIKKMKILKKQVKDYRTTEEEKQVTWVRINLIKEQVEEESIKRNQLCIKKTVDTISRS